MRRREFVGGAVALVLGPAQVHGQSTKLPIVGFLRTTTRQASAHMITAFERGLAESGFASQESYRILFRFADGKAEELPRIVGELIEAEPSVLVGNGISAQFLKASTASIPIVFVTGSDPVRLGLVARINRPGGNITGISFDPAPGTLEPKRLEMLHALTPGGGPLGALTDPSNPTGYFRGLELQKAAAALGRSIIFASASTPQEIVAAFRSFVQRSVVGVVIGGSPLFIGYRRQLVEAAAEHRLPCIYVLREFAIAGGLISYGASQVVSYQEAGRYVARILKGESVGELPVMQASKFELVLNLKTAKSLGIEVPMTLLATATEVIE